MQPTTIEVTLDDDSQKVIDSVHDVHRNTAICLGLKLLSESPIYSSFFSKTPLVSTSEEAPKVNLTESLSSSQQPSSSAALVVDAPAVVEPEVPSAQSSSTSPTSWDNF